MRKVRCTASYDSTPNTATLVACGRRGVAIDTPVMMPSEPSEPMNSCFRSMPVLSLRSVWSSGRISPFGSTTSRPSTLPCSEP